MVLLTFAVALLGGCGMDAAVPPPTVAKEAPSPVSGGLTDSALAHVTLTQAAATAAGIEVLPARAADGSSAESIVEAPAQVEAEPSRMAFISSRAAGRLERLTAVAGERVAANHIVGWVVSQAFVTAQHDFVQAPRRAGLLSATADSSGGRMLAEAARNRLRIFGLSDDDLDQLAHGGAPEAMLPVRAPFEGSLLEGLTLAGASVEAGTPIFRLVDLREVDVAANVPEAFLADLRVGQRASVTLAAFPTLRLSGTVERITDELDPATRTVEARIHVRNPDRTLRPGMFARVQLHVAGKRIATPPEQSRALVVPADAVGTEGEQRYVFVETSPLTYERRPVEVSVNDGRFGGIEASERVVVGTLKPGEQVVVKGLFTLKSELAKANFAEEE